MMMIMTQDRLKYIKSWAMFLSAGRSYGHQHGDKALWFIPGA